MTLLLMFNCFDNNCHKSLKKLNIYEFTKINLNPLNFLTPLRVCMHACVCVCVCGTNTIICILCN